MSQFATLKAIGYENGYLRRVVLQQASLLGLFGFLPGLAASWGLYCAVAGATGLLMRLGPDIAASVFGLTLAMCLIAGWLAVRKVLAADPAEVF